MDECKVRKMDISIRGGREKAMKKGEIVLFLMRAQIMNLIFNLRPNQDSYLTDSPSNLSILDLNSSSYQTMFINISSINCEQSIRKKPQLKLSLELVCYQYQKSNLMSFFKFKDINKKIWIFA